MKSKISLILAVLMTTVAHAASLAHLAITGAPNGSWDAISSRFDPIARYLSQTLGTPVRFRGSSTFVGFGFWVQNRGPAIIFGGPQLLSWANKHYGYIPVLAARGTIQFALVAQSPRIKGFANLDGGQAVCGLTEPNLGTMALMTHFRDPLRQPYLVPVSSPAAALAGVLNGRCLAAAVPLSLLNHLKTMSGRHLHVVAPLGRFPNQGFAVSNHLSPVMQTRIAHALIAAAHAGILRRLQVANGISGWRVPGAAHYVGYGHLVHGLLGYANFAQPTSVAQ